MIARRVIVSGHVQGVGFRYYTQRLARRFGIHGWVQNLADGRVQAWVQSEELVLEAFLKELKRGPSLSRVDEIAVTFETLDPQQKGFEVKSDGSLVNEV